MQRVIAIATLDQVVTGTAVEQVIAGVADQGVGQRVAGAIDVGTARQGQALDVVAQGVADAGLNQIIAGAAGLYDHIPGGINHIRIVANATFHAVVTNAAVECVITAVAIQRIVASQAQEIVIGGIAVDHVGAIARYNWRVVQVEQYIGGAPATAVCKLDSIDLMVCIGKALAYCKGFPSGEDGEHQIVADASQADLVGVEVGQPQGVEVAAGTTGIVDHIEAVALAVPIGIAAAPTQEPVIAGTSIQGVVTTVAQERVITAQPIEGVSRSATRQNIVDIVSIDSGHDLTLYDSDVFRFYDCSSQFLRAIIRLNDWANLSSANRIGGSALLDMAVQVRGSPARARMGIAAVLRPFAGKPAPA
ncbi:hypothetical protein D9M71_296440 [compost metagenome]